MSDLSWAFICFVAASSAYAFARSTSISVKEYNDMISRWRNVADKWREVGRSAKEEAKIADQHRRLAERVAKAAMSERDQLRMRCANLGAVTTEVSE